MTQHSDRPQRAIAGDPDFPYMLADTPEEFERVVRRIAAAPATDVISTRFTGHDGREYEFLRFDSDGIGVRPVPAAPDATAEGKLA